MSIVDVRCTDLERNQFIVHCLTPLIHFLLVVELIKA